MLSYRLRPMSDTTWTGQQQVPPAFKMEWPAMLDFLGAEIDRLGGYDVTIDVHAPADSINVRTGGICRGGLVYSTACAVAFDTEDHGELVLRCDRYGLASYGARSTLATGWQSNVHAIGKHLEALRALDRHGVARGEQYDAYKALPSGSPAAAAAMSAESAIAALLDAAGPTEFGSWPFLPDAQRRVVKLARRHSHPDAGGERAAWETVDQAVQTLVTAGVLPEGI